MRYQVLSLLTASITLAMFLTVGAGEPSGGYRLIAHRGGIVDDNYIEHSLDGLKAAIDRGYWMVEVDVRETKDGFPIVHHDANFSRYYGDSRQVAEMTWSQIQELRSTPGNARPLLLDEFIEACQGKIRLMLEMKGPPHDLAYYESIEKTLRENDLLENAYMIGIQEAKDYFKGKIRYSLQQEGLRQAIAANEDLSKNYFLFKGAHELDKDMIQMARESGVPIVAAVNRHNYRGSNALQRARDDTIRMKRLGVRSFQIDSVYDQWFLK